MKIYFHPASTTSRPDGDFRLTELAGYPNVKRWLGRMKALKSWTKVNEVINGYAASLKGPFVTV